MMAFPRIGRVVGARGSGNGATGIGRRARMMLTVIAPATGIANGSVLG